MPEISRFYGIVVKMFFIQNEHNPPHLHAIYGDYIGTINIKTLEIIEGDLPYKAVALLTEWIQIHQDELLEIWQTQEFKKIPPLV